MKSWHIAARYLTWAFVLMGVASPSEAQTEITLEEAWEHASLHHNELKLIDAQIEEASWALEATQAEWYPWRPCPPGSAESCISRCEIILT